MTVAVNTSGSVTTDGTEQTLATITSTAGIYILVIDLALLAGGDAVEIKIKGKARSSDTERVIYYASYANTQSKPLKESIAVATPHHYVATIKRTAGSDHAYPWAVYSL